MGPRGRICVPRPARNKLARRDNGFTAEYAEDAERNYITPLYDVMAGSLFGISLGSLRTFSVNSAMKAFFVAEDAKVSSSRSLRTFSANSAMKAFIAEGAEDSRHGVIRFV